MHRAGPDPLHPNSDFYSVKISHDDAFVESLLKKPKSNRTAGSDFEIAAEALSTMYMISSDVDGWASAAQKEGGVSQEELDAVAQVATALQPYMAEAIQSTRGRFDIYQEHYEKGVGPLEMGIARRLSLPSKIRTKEDIAQFFAYLYLFDRTSFHPDESFENYVDRENRATYTDEEARIRNRLMAQAWAISEKQGLDIYELSLWVGALAGANDDPPNEASAPAWLKSLSNTWV